MKTVLKHRNSSSHKDERKNNDNGRSSYSVLRSSITWRLLIINLLAPAILAIGALYTSEYRERLINTELETLRTQGSIFAVALAEGAINPLETDLLMDVTQQMLLQLQQITRTQARLFSANGHLVTDTQFLATTSGSIQVEILPPLHRKNPVIGFLLDILDRLFTFFFPNRHENVDIMEERPGQDIETYPEVLSALKGVPKTVIRKTENDTTIYSVAVPIRYDRGILGVLMLSRENQSIDITLYEARVKVLQIFVLALTTTILLSLYMAGTIARPLVILARAAERIRREQNRQYPIPDFKNRHGEIGYLSESIRNMTEALWLRMDSIERFAADVAHEIKNPLASIRSAVEALSCVKGKEQQKQLLDIIQHDVRRVDRLVTDISDTSRLDTELSRAKMQPLDIVSFIEVLAGICKEEAASVSKTLVFQNKIQEERLILGIEDRLTQVFRNIVVNALSFSPVGGTVWVTIYEDKDQVSVSIEDEGPGIPEGEQQKIFERFYTKRPETEDFGLHSGLGLSISKQIIETHKGHIVAKNRDDRQGACFIMSLPKIK